MLALDVVTFGEQAARDCELLHLSPFGKGLFRALERDDVRILGCGVVEPIKGVAHILAVAVAGAFLAAELVKG